MAQKVKSLPAMWETWKQSLGQEDTLEKEMAAHSSVLAWKIPWMEEPGRLWGHKNWAQLSNYTTKQSPECPHFPIDSNNDPLPYAVEQIL